MSDGRIILILEPDAGTLVAARDALSRAGFRVLATRAPREAHRHLYAGVDLMLADRSALARLAPSAWRDVPVLVSYRNGGLQPDDFVGECAVGRLAFPYTEEALLGAVRSALGLDDEATNVGAEIEYTERTPLGASGLPLGRKAAALPAAAVAMGPAGADTPDKVALAGSLAAVPLDQVLQIVAQMDQLAVCRLTSEPHGGLSLYFRGGRVCFGQAEGTPRGLALGRIFIEMGVLSDREVDGIVAAGGEEPLGQRLLRRGLVTEQDLRAALERQTEELVYDAIRWRTGRFVVELCERLPRRVEEADLSLSVQHLLLEGARRLDEWERLRGELGPNARFRSVGEVSPSVLDHLSPSDRIVLAYLSDERSLDEILEGVPRPAFSVFRALHSLHGRSLVRRHEEPAPN